MTTCLLPYLLWLTFATPNGGELFIERTTITAINHNVDNSMFCIWISNNTCEYEKVHKYFICQTNICHEIVWDKSFEELKKLITN